MYHASKNHCSPIFVLILTPVIKYSFLYQVCLDHSLRLTDLIPILFCSFPQFGPINNIKIIIMSRDSNNTYILDFTQSSPCFLYFTNNTHTLRLSLVCLRVCLTQCWCMCTAKMSVSYLPHI